MASYIPSQDLQALPSCALASGFSKRNETCRVASDLPFDPLTDAQNGNAFTLHIGLTKRLISEAEVGFGIDVSVNLSGAQARDIPICRPKSLQIAYSSSCSDCKSWIVALRVRAPSNWGVST